MSAIKDQIDMFRFVSWLKVIVITGGPCGGKSTFLRMAIRLLEKYGITVIVVPEAARELIAAGFHPKDLAWKHSDSFQELVFRTILERETFYFKALDQLDLKGKSVVFLCDRGLMDGAAYMGEDSFIVLLDRIGVSCADVLDRYAGVISLTSAAIGAPESYKTDGERHESLEEAAMLDVRTTAAWHRHQHLSIVDNSTDFPQKINRALQALGRLLAISMKNEIEKKYRVDQFSMGQIPVGAQSYEIKQIYLSRADRPGIECRVRCKTTGGKSSYYYTEKITTDTEGVRGESEVQVTAARYVDLINRFANAACSPVEKTRHKFLYGPQVMELDVYKGRLKGLVTLETEFLSEEDMVAFVPPPNFTLTDVTAFKHYSNRMLAEFGVPIP